MIVVIVLYGTVSTFLKIRQLRFDERKKRYIMRIYMFTIKNW